MLFPASDNWSSLERDYGYLKSMLTAKYGEATDCVEEFQGYTSPETDSEKLLKVKTDECTWYTTYSTPKGKIRLAIENQSMVACNVVLVYADKVNIEASNAQAIDDL